MLKMVHHYLQASFTLDKRQANKIKKEVFMWEEYLPEYRLNYYFFCTSTGCLVHFLCKVIVVWVIILK